MLNTKEKHKTIPEVMIFCPLPPGSGWRGEGIAQTVENIIRHSSSAVRYNLVIGKHVEHEIRESMQQDIQSKKLRLTAIGWKKRDALKVQNHASTLLNYLSKCLFLCLLGIFILKRIVMSACGINKNNCVFAPIPVLALPALLFSKNVIASFWDPFVFEYPHGFSKRLSEFLMRTIYKVMHTAPTIVTQSNANMVYLKNFLGVDANKIHVIENGSPDYGAYKSTFPNSIDKIYTFWHKTDCAKTHVNCLANLNLAVLHRLLHLNILGKIHKTILISTQFRPYKGFESLFEVLDLLITKHIKQYRFKIVMTASIPNTFYEKYPWANSLVFQMRRLTNKQHAYICSLSDLVIHPSFVEGGVGTYPMFEAASLGVPSLSNVGRHMLELQQKSNKNISTLFVDLLDKKSSVNSIHNMLLNTKLRKRNIMLVNSLRIEWAYAAKKYTKLFKNLT